MMSFNATAQIYLNQFTGASACPTPGNIPALAANATGTPLSRNTVICTNALNAFNSTTLNNTGSIVNTSYIEFSVSANAGYGLDLTSLSFFRQGSNTAPNRLEVRYSTDGFITSTTWGAATNTPTSGSVITWDFADFSVNSPNTLSFRFYPYGTQRCDLTATPAASGGTFRLDDVTLNGTVVTTATLSASTTDDFGNVCINTTTGANIFTITGTSLTTANVTVGPLAGYQFSTTNGSFQNSLSLAQPGGAYSQDIYVTFNPTLVQSYDGNVPIGGGGATATTTPVTGSGFDNGPTISNGVASAITTNSATITVNVSDPGCSAVVPGGYGVEYSTTTPFANGTGTAVTSANLSAGVFSVDLLGLVSPGTTFYYHTYATNSSGVPTYGVEQSFTLLSTVPVLNVPGAGAGSLTGYGNVCINTGLAVNSFNLSGSVLNGTNIVVGPLANFSFSLNAGGPFTATLTLVNGGAGYSYSGGVLNATVYTKFLPTAVQSYNGSFPISGGGAPAISVSVTGSGVNNIPALTTGSPLFIGTTNAILPGTLIDEGCGVLFGYGIEYSTTPAFIPGTGTQIAGSNLGGGDFSVNIGSLTPGVTYYYYAYGVNNGGTGYGTINSFTCFTVPTKLVILSVSPATPTAGSSFSITVQAQDAANNPVDITSNTGLTFAPSGVVPGVFIFPGVPAGTMADGSSIITISGLSYDQVGTVALTVTASSGMTGLGTSLPFSFNVIAYTGSLVHIWDADGLSKWTTAGNWFPTNIPGSPGNVSNNEVAVFQAPSPTYGGDVQNAGVGGSGINMNDWTGNAMSIGTVYFNQTYNYSMSNNGDILPMGNSSGSVAGTMNLWGSNLINVGGISGNNYTSLLIGNYMSHATTKTLQIQNKIGAASNNFTLNLSSAGSIVAGAGRTININVLLTGTQNLNFAGGGTFSLAPVLANNAIVNNTFSGAISVDNGTLITGNTGALNPASPNVITLGSGSTAGILRLNGTSIAVGGLSTAGSMGGANIVDNGNASAGLAIKNASGNIFNGTLANGSIGILSISKSGAGTMSLTGLNTYTGSTTVTQGILQLNRTGGSTIPSGNSVSVSSTGVLRISSDQTLANLTLSTGGKLQVDAGVTLTITGTYNPATCFIQNDGTIRLQGGALQSFPGTNASVISMNNLIINNAFGVNLNKSINVTGILTLTNGAFTVGANTLTINNPIAGTVANLSANNTSSITVAGTAAGVNIPASVSQLNNLTVSNTIGSSLQGNMKVFGTLFITATAGNVDADLFTLDGTGNLTMNGGNLIMAKNGVVLPELTGAYSLSGGTVTFNGVGITVSDAQTIRPVNYFNLASTDDGDRILSSTGTIGVANVFTPHTNVYFISGSTVNFNKTTAGQTIPAFTFNNIRISGGGSVTKTLAGHINIEGTLGIAAFTKLELSAFNATLRSNATTGTANVDVIPTANSITYSGSGRFIVERYLPVGTTHAKSWQFLAAPSKGQTINAAWQEGNVLPAVGTPGLGTILSTNNTGGTGFDIIGGVAPSIKTFNPAGAGTWDGVTSTLAQIANNKGYMVFIRGDRTVTTASQPAVATTLRTTGKLYAPGLEAPSTSTVIAGKLESIGNPYASAIDFTNLQSTSAGIDTKFYVWDPLLPGTNGYGYGGFQTLGSANGYLPIPGGTANYPTGVACTKIQSGQAFFVYSTPGGTVVFNESNKTSGSQDVFRVNTNGFTGDRQFLRSNVYTADNRLIDGNVVAFDDDFVNAFEANDAIKIQNFGENFSVLSQQKRLSLEARKPVSVNDTIFYHLANLRAQAYQIRIEAENMDAGGLSAFIVDRFTGAAKPLSLSGSTPVDFTNQRPCISAAPNRFYIIFRLAGPVPVTLTTISANRNSNGSIDVTWDVENEINIVRYELERSGDGRFSQSISNTAPAVNNGGRSRYQYTDAQPLSGDNFYRIKAISLDGRSQYSSVVKVGPLKGPSLISVYPNPVVNGQINLAFQQQASGTYQVYLYNQAGQMIYHSQQNIATNNAVKLLSLGNKARKGVHQLVVIAENGTKTILPLLIQ